MLSDLTAAVFAFALFPLVFILPGYVTGWASGVFGFRGASFWRRMVLSGLLSVSVVPILVHLIARAASFEAALAVLGLSWFAFLYQFMDSRKVQAPPAWAVAAVVAWVVMGYLLIADIHVDGGLVHSMSVHDYLKHVAVADAVARTGIPPANPSFYPGEPLSLYYYYFWFMLCALADRLGGGAVDAMAAVHAGALWTGLVFMGLVLESVRQAARDGIIERPPPYRLALALLLVTGLDIVPTVVYGVIYVETGLGPGILPDLEWWNEQVSSWTGTMVWVPHHLAGFVACMTGFLLLRHGGGRIATVLAGLAFASTAGLSIWVALVGAAALGAWMVVSAFARKWGEVGKPLAAGSVSAVAVAPYLLDLLDATRGEAPPLRFAVREFWPVTKLSEWFGVDVSCGWACKFGWLPVSYGLEFGAFAFAAALYWLGRRGRGKGDEQRFLVVMALAALFVCSFVRADIHNNDLAWRGLLFVQLPLLLWALPVVGAMKGRVLPALLVLGVLGTAAEAARSRFTPATQRNADLAQAYRWIDANTPSDAVIQHNPDRKIEAFHALYGHRQVVVSDHLYGRLYAVGSKTFDPVYAPVRAVFVSGADVDLALRVSKRFDIDYLVATPDDGVWRDGWPRAATPVFANAHARVYSVDALGKPSAR